MMKIVNIISLLQLLGKQSLARIKKLLPAFLFLPVLIFLLFFNREKLLPPIFISNEDGSFTSKMLMSGIMEEKLGKAVRFQESSLEEGLLALEEGRASALFYLKEGTTTKLLNGERVDLGLYVSGEESGFSKFLIGYIKGFLEIINTAQNSGLYYMDYLYEEGMSDEEREEIFTELQLSYVAKALERDKIIEGSRDKKGYFYLKNIYLIGGLSLFFLLLLTTKKPIFFEKRKKERLLLSGYRLTELYAAAFFYRLCFFVLFLILMLAGLKQIGLG